MSKHSEGWVRQRKHRRPLYNTVAKLKWAMVIDAVSGRCCGCGEKAEPITRDHVVPIASGGKASLLNLQPLCLKCNAGKGTRHIDYRGPALKAVIEAIDRSVPDQWALGRTRRQPGRTWLTVSQK